MTRREKIFWLIVGAIFVIGFIFLIPAYGQICEPNKNGSQGDCSRYHVALVAIWHIAKFLDDHNGVMIAIATGVVAWFTYSLRQSTDKLWDAGERQFRHAESEAEGANFYRTAQFEQITEQIAALRQSAEAAEDTARETRNLVGISDRTAMRQLRAYVHVDFAQIPEFKTGMVRMRMVFKNSGQTPAYKFGYWANIGADTNPPQSGFSTTSNSPRVIKAILPAGAESTVFAEYGPLSESQVTRVLMKQVAIWTWGELTYEDVFGQSRTTKFRMVFDGTSTTPPGGMAFASEGNEAD